MLVRPERAEDLAHIRAVHEASFPTRAEADLVDALRAAGRLAISRVAEEGDTIIGHVAFSPVNVSGAAGLAVGLGLAPVAVLPTWRRRGIGERLVRDGLEAGLRLDRGFVVVLGDPNYYARCGFVPASRWGLRDAFGGGEAFQALELRHGAIPAGGGLASYAPEFAAVA